MISTGFPHFGGYEFPNPPLAAARIVVLPILYEQAPSYGAGSAEGPIHLLRASEQLERLDEETEIDWAGLVIHTTEPMAPDTADPGKAVAEMRAAAGGILEQGKRLLTIGGDHAVSIGPITAMAERFPGLGVLQVDAHLDLREEWNGSRYNHACVMRRVVEDLGLPVVQVGIRALSTEELAFVRKRDLKPVFAHSIEPVGEDWMEKTVERLPERVYLSIDLDGLDPSVLPGTGTPEPGGLTYRQLVSIIRILGRRRRVVGADIVELVKLPGTQVSEYTAAKIAAKIFVHCWARG